ncbi:hypothetical protein [Paraglaciecola arctica]|uniref:hypothetical protein n=1 Tax=Paraglaciecola arctica TaxID=1128911 RepID=UPI001C0799A3|nr:hypothetical protein [Paraglaciecola arctica]MBU3005675.1 hypothetical protein [Paraglaciecola arctica]
MMFRKKVVLSLYSSLFLFFSYTHSASGNLLTDPDGLNVSLYSDGFLSDNEFGPISVTMGYEPVSDGNILPAGMNDGSEMEVSFFANSISFVQEVTTGLPDPIITLGWTMTIDDIDWPAGHEIVSVGIISSTYLTNFSVDFTANTLIVRYDGGDAIDTGDLWQGAITFATEQTDVAVPPILSLILLGCLGVCSRRAVN